MSKAIPALLAAAIVSFSCATPPSASVPASPKPPQAASGLSEGQRIKKSLDLTNQARSSIDKDDNSGGLDLANQAIELDPNNGDAYLQQGRSYRNLNKRDKALESFELALKNSASNPAEVQINKAVCMREMGKAAQSKEILEKVLSASPDEPWANRELGNFYFNDFRDIDKAIYYFEKSIANGADDPWIYNDISVAFEKKGDQAKAAEYLRKAKEKIDSGQGDQWVKDQVAERSARLML